MMRSSSYQSQNPANTHSGLEEQEELESPFFDKSNRQKNSAFFQTKLTVGEPGDQYEKEADNMADKVVNQSTDNSLVQQKEISGIQRLATDKEEEKLGTNDARMLRDKEIQEKPEVQHKGEGSSGTTASAALSSRIQDTSGKGSALPSSTQAEMSSSFNADFSQVKVHTDTDSISMNKELKAQAFTHGRDIYFNSNKYAPDTQDGKRLLAHELTHVVQQGHASQEKADDQQ